MARQKPAHYLVLTSHRGGGFSQANHTGTLRSARRDAASRARRTACDLREGVAWEVQRAGSIVATGHADCKGSRGR